MDNVLKEKLNQYFREATEAMKREDYLLAEEKYHMLAHLSLILYTESAERIDRAEYYSLSREYANKESYARRMRECQEKLTGFHGEVSFSEFVGEEKAKSYLKEDIVIPFQNGKLLDRKKTGLLIYGPHGVGKTPLVLSLAYELSMKIFQVNPLDDFRSDNYPDAINSVKRVFDSALEEKCSMVFIEDPLCFFPKGEEDSLSYEISSLFLSLLRKEMRKMKRKKASVLFVATTDCPDKLDDRLFEKGLFDDYLRLDLPDEHTREALVLKYAPRFSEEQIARFVKETDGYPSWQITKMLQELSSKGAVTTEAIKEVIASEEKERDDGFYENVGEFERKIK